MKRLTISLLHICITTSLFAQDSLTVEQAVQRVLQTHPAIEQANANTRAAEARVSQASSPNLPEISTDAVYTHIGPVPAFSFPSVGNIILAPADNYDAHIGAKYTLIDFGKTNAAVDLNRSQVQSSRDAIELTRENLALQTIQSFYSVILMRKSMEVQDEQINALNQHLSVTQKQVLTGTATSFEVLTTQVRVAAAQNQRVEIQNSLQKQEIVLRQLLNLPAEIPLLIRGSFQKLQVGLDKDSLARLAGQQRAELKLAKDAVQSAQLQKRLSSRGNMPTLKVNAVYGTKNGYEPNLYVLRNNWAWGVQAQIPIFDGGRVNYQEEEAQANVEAQEAHVQDVTRQVRSDVEQAVANVQAASSKVQISEVQLHQAIDAVAIARTRYETGSITNLDLLDAETSESAAKLTNLQALYRLVISKYELDRAIGASLEERIQ